jgi:hypothetical protein
MINANSDSSATSKPKQTAVSVDQSSVEKLFEQEAEYMLQSGK